MALIFLLLLLQIAAIPVKFSPSDFAIVETGVPSLLKSTIPETQVATTRSIAKFKPIAAKAKFNTAKLQPNPMIPWNLDGPVDAAVKVANILTPALDLAGQLDPKGRAFLGLAKFMANVDPKALQKIQRGAFTVLAGTDIAGSVHEFQIGKLIKGGLTNIENLKGHVKSLGDQYMQDLKASKPVHQARQVLNTITPLIPLLPAGSPPRTMTQSAVLAANLAGLMTPENVRVKIKPVP